MPLSIVRVAIEHGETYQNWDALSHLASPSPLPYVIPPNYVFHAEDDDREGFTLSFPNLATVGVGEDGRLAILNLDHKFPHEVKIKRTEHISPEYGPSLRRACDNLCSAAALQLVYMYCVHGMGRQEERLVKMVFGGPSKDVYLALSERFPTMPDFTLPEVGNEEGPQAQVSDETVLGGSGEDEHPGVSAAAGGGSTQGGGDTTTDGNGGTPDGATD